MLSKSDFCVGVGLRDVHFEEALLDSATIDFVEVHSENFFADGGYLPQLLLDISDKYPISLHSTAMGLGSSAGIPENYLKKIDTLTRNINPFLMSDHAAFSWGFVDNKPVHAGDLLPIEYNDDILNIMANNIDKIQQRIGQPLLIENLSTYINLPNSTMSEQEFLAKLVDKAQCGLLIDLNNILVNAYNHLQDDYLKSAIAWLDNIPSHAVGEIHLAGFSKPKNGDLAIDDHSQPISELCWSLYRYALNTFGATPTLIEWDRHLPSWPKLLDQAQRARQIGLEVLKQ